MTDEKTTALAERSDAPLVPRRHPMDLLADAVDKGVSVEMLDRLMGLEERHRANQARDAYVTAMSLFRSESIAIEKTKKVDFASKSGGRVSFVYAPLSQIIDVIAPRLGAHGLSHFWTTEQPDGQVRVTCTIRHSAGHSESTSLTAPPDTTGLKTPAQAIASTVTTLERYTLLALTGLAAGDQADADEPTTVEAISGERLETIKKLIDETGTELAAFLAWAEVDAIDKIPVAKFDECCAMLNRKKRRKPAEPK